MRIVNSFDKEVNKETARRADTNSILGIVNFFKGAKRDLAINKEVETDP